MLEDNTHGSFNHNFASEGSPTPYLHKGIRTLKQGLGFRGLGFRV